ncbi:MAG: hypothetical protein KatS3mg119_2249 [Rhodothalassiaceae bacterium]|nr:MAG: hypothetical protein KatS3mg119_2249 [Rhodothalassiaceae bacterium]
MLLTRPADPTPSDAGTTLPAEAVAITVVVPVGPGDGPAFEALARRLGGLAPGLAVIRAAEGTRARSLNAGARAARTPFLWFLHADCAVEARHLEALAAALRRAPDAVHFFDLAFVDDGPRAVHLNARGGNLRARLLRLPFGDQGLAMHRDTWERLGGFPEDLPHGEDHVFVWRAHLEGVPVRRIPLPLPTSARAYREAGWLRLTLLRQWLWLRQAAPFALRLAARRLAGRRG